MSGALLDIHDLRISRAGDGLEVLRGVSLKVRPGEVVGLAGASGAGKTTLGLAALGHVRHGLRLSGGRVRLAGLPLFSLPEPELAALRAAQLGYVAQNAAVSFNPTLRLMAQVGEAVLLHGLMGREDAEERARLLGAALGLDGFDELARRFAHQLSGGQLQRMMAVMAMTSRPGLIVLDEPATALDADSQARVAGIIARAVAESGAAALWIGHDPGLLAEVSRRICVMKDGRIIEEGAARKLARRPAHPYTQALWNAQAEPVAAADDAPVVLEARNIRASYGSGGAEVLHDVSISLRKGQTLALTGPSGSGKTTLGRVLAGLLRPDGGEVVFAGQSLPPLKRRSRQLRRRMQFMHQSADSALNPAQRAEDILLRPLRLFFGSRGEKARARAGELMEMVELDRKLLSRPVAQLSGGQKQRLMLARALAAQPEVMICDETTSALDPLTRRAILRLLARMQEQHGIAMLFITHDMVSARSLAHHVAVMEQGRIGKHGPASEIFAAPAASHG